MLKPKLKVERAEVDLEGRVEANILHPTSASAALWLL